MMEYVITSGVPGKGPCAVTGFDGMGTYIYYRGWFDPQKEMWRLYPMADTPREHRAVVTAGIHQVRLAVPKKQHEKKKPQTEREDEKPKAWWTLPDPEGQISIL